MKKLLCVGLVVLMSVGVFTPTVATAADPGAAGLLSAMMPGAGEWYNRGWRGSFPWGECIIGSICFLFKFSSVVDAVYGDNSDGMRLDFWSAP